MEELKELMRYKRVLVCTRGGVIWLRADGDKALTTTDTQEAVACSNAARHPLRSWGRGRTCVLGVTPSSWHLST